MAEIKISELSIGDWVEWKVYDKTYVIRITQITDTIMRGVHDGIEYGVLLKQISPIPLTPEILEKNGFSHNGRKWYTPELFTLERWGDDWSIVIACSCGEYVCEVCTIKYVHQLQHALRLAGVVKEIVL